MNGKGDARRPATVSEEELNKRWAETFKKNRASVETEQGLTGSEVSIN